MQKHNRRATEPPTLRCKTIPSRHSTKLSSFAVLLATSDLARVIVCGLDCEPEQLLLISQPVVAFLIGQELTFWRVPLLRQSHEGVG